MVCSDDGKSARRWRCSQDVGVVCTFINAQFWPHLTLKISYSPNIAGNCDSSITIVVGSSSVGSGGNLQLQSGLTSDENELGGSTSIQAGNGVGGGGPISLQGAADLSTDELDAWCPSRVACPPLAMGVWCLLQVDRPNKE